VDAEAAPCLYVCPLPSPAVCCWPQALKPDEEAAVALLSFKSAKSQPTTTAYDRKDAILPEIQSN